MSPKKKKTGRRGHHPATAGPTPLIASPFRDGQPESTAPEAMVAPGDDAEWFTVALRAVAKLAAANRPFQCHDLAMLCGVPEPRDHHMWGSLMSIARSEGIVTAVAAVPSSRPRTARSLCRLWIGSRHASEASEVA